MKQDALPRRVEVPPESAGRRLDQVLADLFPEYSRSRLQQWVKEGRVRVDGKSMRPKDKLQGIELIELDPFVEPEKRWEAEPIPLDIHYEDDHIIVINKPVGLVVHPAVGNREGTLLNALLHHAPELAGVPRAGIVHRLDKETSGLLVVARTLEAQTALVAQLQERTMTREYRAVVTGVMTGGGTVEAPIGRHPVDRKRMAVTPNGKPAVTHYRVVERFRGHTDIRVRLETGRTHQIRVHMAHIRYPLVGDPVYGGRLKLPKGCSDELRQALRGFRRQALHAGKLGVVHPHSGLTMEWEVELPQDMSRLLEALRKDAEQEGSL